jgi:hypothetical protein
MSSVSEVADREIGSAEASYILRRSDRQVRRYADAGVLRSSRLTPRSPRRYRLLDVLALVTRPQKEPS